MAKLHNAARLHAWGTAFVLCAVLWLAGTGAHAQESTAIRRDERSTWTTVTLGTRKGPNDYRNALNSLAIRIGDSANEILGRPAFPYARTPRHVEIVVVTGRDLGMQAGSEPLAQIYDRARRAGLELCPPEVGPQLRLAYREQPRGEVLHVAMEPVKTWHGEPIILALANFGTGLLLIGSDGRPDFMVPKSFRFVFALPDKRPLEARRQ